jgi:hypothetical protein
MANDNETINLSISQLNEAFSGRPKSAGFDETKRYQIHRRNRAYVWTAIDKNKLLESILKGRYIPPIITVETILNNRIVRYVVDGGHRITTFRFILDDMVRPLTEAERRIVETYQINVVVLRNLTSKQIREQFRVLQSGKRVSSGQLYAMSEDCPIVIAANNLLRDPAHPLRATIARNFFDTVNAIDGAGQRNLENALAMVSGALHGPKYITTSFDRQEEVLELPVDQDRINRFLQMVFDIFDMTNEIVPQSDGRVRKGQWTLGTYIGPMMYDLHKNPTRQRAVQEKWRDYIVMVRERVPLADEAIETGGANNITEVKLQRIIVRVNAFVEERRLLSKEEVEERIRRDETESVEEDDEEEQV